MRFNLKVLCFILGGLMVLHAQATRVHAADFYPVATNIDMGAVNFGTAYSAAFGGYVLNSAATLEGNDVLSITQPAMNLAGSYGASVILRVSNGENGNNGAAGSDIPNATPANPAFAAIGNASGRLENGNVIRMSAWFRSDPAQPITGEPQVPPILKIEYWTEGLSVDQDTNGIQAAPTFGDRIFDQDQQGHALFNAGLYPDAQLPHFLDVNGDSAITFNGGPVPAARVHAGLNTSGWTLATVTHTVNSSHWLGINGYGANQVGYVEAIQGVMFLGHFSATPVAGPGNLLVDNLLMEVFKDAASVTALNNPAPGAGGLPGDFNSDGKVDAADYTVWRDANGTAANYALWKANFGTGGGSVGGGPVPEPTSLLLLSLAVAGVGIGSRRRCG